MLTKYVKDGYEETEEEKMERLMKVTMQQHIFVLFYISIITVSSFGLYNFQHLF